MRTEAPLLAPIFRSDGQARILSELLIGGGQLSVTELAARVGLAYPTVHREVGRLLGGFNRWLQHSDFRSVDGKACGMVEGVNWA